VIRLALARIGTDYLVLRPPCFLDEPYEITWLLSYCDTRLHRGTVYAASGFARYRVNARGIETWRIPLPGLSPAENARVQKAAEWNARSRRFRSARATAGDQLALGV
jgi:hypothetical protein